MTEQTVAFDRQTRRRFVSAIRIFLSSDVRWQARGLFALLIAFALAINGLNVVNSYVGRDFITAIADRNQPGFIRQALLYIAVFAGSTVVLVVYQFTQDRFGLFWRVWLTRRIVGQYLADRAYLRIKQSATVENPDERIAEDVRAFTATTLSFTVMLVNGGLAVLSFSGVLWTISRPLFGVAIGYACLGSLVTIFLGRRLISLNYRQLDREAAFRSNLIHVRTNAESIAVSRREGRLMERLMGSLDDLAANVRRTIAVNRRLGFFTTGYNYLIQIIPALLVAPLFIRGKVEFGVVTQSAMAFAQVVGAFSIIVDQFQSISSFGAVIVRVSALTAAIEKPPSTEAAAIALTEADGRIAYDHLTLATPDGGTEVLKNLTAEIPHGTRVLVVGHNETARTALFEATAGIWPTGHGTVTRPSLDRIAFLPQRPYLPPGTLRDALLGDGAQQVISDEQITTTLHDMELDSIVARAGGLDSERDWPATLSLREQQLLALARVILARPAFAMLDRVDVVLEPAQLRQALRRLDDNSITYVALAENSELIEQYDAMLEIRADGTWKWTPAHRDPAKAAARGHS
jgi:vitamin B12/bleomycin/antimicrobial peptide transport system ATP-binding/permease protein